VRVAFLAQFDALPGRQVLFGMLAIALEFKADLDPNCKITMLGLSKDISSSGCGYSYFLSSQLFHFLDKQVREPS